MDSGNSGSMQSSSAGEEEYDSRASASTDTFSAFLNTGSFLNPPISLSTSSTTTTAAPPTLFDHVTPFSHSYTLDPVWPQIQNYQTTLPAQSPSPLLGPPFPGPSPQRPMTETTRPDQPSPVVKNPRKRTRASRRAPTTVLTTDTTNFRQMVQEFTGIPSPPFSATSSSSSPYSRRLDLFGQLYPVRPSAHKVVNSTASIANVAPNNSGIAATPATSNNIFSTTYSQLLGNPSSTIGGFTSSLQNQLLSHQSLMFGSSKTTPGDSQLIEMGITQDHINANLSAFLSDAKGIGRENNNRDGVQEIAATRNEEGGGINSWNFSEEL